MADPADIERQPPLGFFNYAELFLDAARHLARAADTGELHLRFDAPIYFLYSHALELTLKAFLRAKGYSAQCLASRELGHKLGVLWRECIKEGLGTGPVNGAFIEAMIDVLDPLAAAYEFRYLKVGQAGTPAETNWN